MVRVEGSCTVRALAEGPSSSDVHGVNTHIIEHVFNLSSEGRTASQLRLELSMESNEKQVAVSSVLVEASTEGATKGTAPADPGSRLHQRSCGRSLCVCQTKE